jgi:nucleoside-diphosphate-sugar epimerase
MRFLGYEPRVGLEQGLAAQVEWAVREKVAVATV